MNSSGRLGSSGVQDYGAIEPSRSKVWDSEDWKHDRNVGFKVFAIGAVAAAILVGAIYIPISSTGNNTWNLIKLGFKWTVISVAGLIAPSTLTGSALILRSACEASTQVRQDMNARSQRGRGTIS